MTASFRLFLRLFVLLNICAACSRADDSLDSQVAQATLVKAGAAAPDFACQSIDGRSFTLSAQKGKVVVLYFFSTSVKASIIEMKNLEKEVFQKLRARDDFQLIAIGRGHTHDDLVRIGGENQLSLPLVADPQAGIYGRYFTKFVPRMVVVGRDGTLASLTTGYLEFAGILRLQRTLEQEFGKGR
ncbi:MAG TPA: TlpA disulfide reductase family protein [Prosthecobacter sp.]